MPLFRCVMVFGLAGSIPGSLEHPDFITSVRGAIAHEQASLRPEWLRI